MLQVPFGAAPAALGLKEYRDQAPIVPSSFAVTDDGFWVLDPQKRRLCLFSPAGRLLRSIPGVDQIGSDMAIDANGDPVIINREPQGEMLRLEGGTLSEFTLGWPAWRLLQTDDGALSVNLKPTDQPGDPVEFVMMDGRQIDSISASGADLAVIPEGQPGRNILATALWRRQFEPDRSSGAISADLLGDMTLSGNRGYFRVSPGSRSNRDGGRANPQYLLELNLDTGRVISYQRIEQGSLDDTNQATHFAVHDGSVYQLVVTPTQIEIRRRTN